MSSRPEQEIDVAAAEALLGRPFANPALLATAFTHQSYAHGREGVEDNQRLEFLGDAVLGLLAADALFRDDPEADEGLLTRRRSALVSGEALAALATQLGLPRLMRFSEGVRDQVERAGERTAAALLEALFGAVWLDGGPDVAQALFTRLFAESLARLRAGGAADVADPRSRLQTLSRHLGRGEPEYRVLASEGDGRAFNYRVEVSAGDAVATADGPSKRKAFAAAAAKLLAALEAGGDGDGATGA